MERELQIGDSAYLKKPERGYRYVEVVGCEGCRLIVKTTSRDRKIPVRARFKRAFFRVAKKS